MRRGAYTNFDPSKMLPGEWAVVLSNDPNATNGRAVYICFAAGDVKRIATIEDMADYLDMLSEETIAEITAELTSDLTAATTAARTAASQATDAKNTAIAATTAANTATANANSAANAANGAAVSAGALSLSSANTQVTTEDAAYAPLLALSVDGQSVQETTTGKNLYSIGSTANTSGITVAQIDASSFRLSGTTTAPAWQFVVSPHIPVTGGEQYTMMIRKTEGSDYNYKNPYASMAYFDSSGKKVGADEYTTRTFDDGHISSTAPADASYTVITVNVISSGIVTDGVYSVQLELGSTPTSYEPYTGGKPSPSPDYPQEIACVRGRNLLTNLAAISNNGLTASVMPDNRIKVTGTSTSTTAVMRVINDAPVEAFKAGGTYTISSGGRKNVYHVTLFGTDDKSSFTTLADMTADGNITFTLAKEYAYYRLNVCGKEKAAGVNYDEIITIQLERGTTATPYVPYGCVGVAVTKDGNTSVTPIDLKGHELHGLPDTYRDELRVDAAGHVELVKRCGVVEFDGSESWFGGDGANLHVYKPIDAKAPASSLLASHWHNPTINANNYLVLLGLTSSRDDWTGLLSDSPMNVLYPLATPQTIDLGYIDMPQSSDGATVEVLAEVTPGMSARWWTAAAQPVSDALQAFDARKDAEVAALVDRVAALES